jgi:3-phenylpropionate/trans-cinnamate dioxygenase ferredoxin subunit
MNTGNFMEAGKASEFKDGDKKKVTLKGQEIMLARVGDRFYATQNRCAHMGGDLAAGVLKGTIITCPRHGSQFDITDGHNVRWMTGEGIIVAMSKIVKSPRPIRTYNVKVDGDSVLIEV